MTPEQSPLRQRMGGAVAALPEAGLALTCLAALVSPAVAKAFAPKLLLTLALEFIAIQAFLPLGVLAIWRPRHTATRVIRVVVFLGIALGYSAMVSDWGWDAIVSFWLLTVSTYFGFLVHDASDDRRQMLKYRWVAALCAWFGWFLLLWVITELANIGAPTKGFLFGLTFFGTLTALEATRFYDRLIPPPRREEAVSDSTPYPPPLDPGRLPR